MNKTSKSGIPTHNRISRTACTAMMVMLAVGALRAAASSIYWDDGDGHTATINSTGWNDIQAAINNATNNPATAGFVKLSGDFTRTLGDTNVGSLVISNHNITLSGGWDGTFTTQNGRSMLNVNGTNTVNNKFRVVDIWGTNVTVSSLVIMNGYLKTVPGADSAAGIWVRRPAVGTLLDNLLVAGNKAETQWDSTSGGGIQIGEGGNFAGPSGTRVRNCQIVNNVVYGGGAGIHIADAGTTNNPVVIENCTIANNIAYANASQGFACGGGIGLGDATSADVNTASHVVFANCRIVQNQSAQYGAGIGLQGWTAYSRVEFFGCLIASNYWRTGATQKAGNAIAVGTPGADGNWNGYTGFGGLAYLVNCTVVDNTQPSQPAAASGFHVNPSPYDEGRLILINSLTRSNELGFTDVRYGGTDYNTHNYTDFQDDTVSEARYVEIDPTESNVTNATMAGAISTSGNPTPAFRTLTTSGTLTNTLQENIEGDPNFRGSGADPYQLTAASANALNNALSKKAGGYTYIDVNLDGSYTPGWDIIVAGTPPAGSNLVYTTDLLGNPRVVGGGLDRGAYECGSISGTVLFVQ